MTEKIPPAFPVVANNHVYTAGMTLRDYFAGQALAGILADPDADPSYENVVKGCYRYADAMLAARDTSVNGESE